MPNLSPDRQSPPLVALGSAVRRLRRDKGISQENLALLTEIDRAYLGRVERGDNNAKLLTIVRIASALEVTVTELMAEAGL